MQNRSSVRVPIGTAVCSLLGFPKFWFGFKIPRWLVLTLEFRSAVSWQRQQHRPLDCQPLHRAALRRPGRLHHPHQPRLTRVVRVVSKAAAAQARHHHPALGLRGLSGVQHQPQPLMNLMAGDPRGARRCGARLDGWRWPVNNLPLLDLLPNPALLCPFLSPKLQTI